MVSKNAEFDYPEMMNHIMERKCDTDSNACIAGELIEAHVSYENLVRDARTEENMKILFASNTKSSVRSKMGLERC